MISSKEAVVQAGGAVNELVGEAGKAVRKLLGGWTKGDSCHIRWRNNWQKHCFW